MRNPEGFGCTRFEASDAKRGVALLTIDDGEGAKTVRLQGQDLIRFVQAVGDVYLTMFAEDSQAALIGSHSESDKET